MDQQKLTSLPDHLSTTEEALPTPGHIRILIADDHSLFRDGLCALFGTVPKFEVVGTTSDPDCLMARLLELRPDILLLDSRLAQRNGVTLLKAISESGLNVRTILLSSLVDKADVMKAFQLGAAGLLLKQDNWHALEEVITNAMAGRVWLDLQAVTTLVTQIQNPQQRGALPVPRPKFGLTTREMEILISVVRGFSNVEIATQLALSPHTVKHHVGRIFDKVGVSNRLELALFAMEHHLVNGKSAASEVAQAVG